jgi:hypothetical protein
MARVQKDMTVIMHGGSSTQAARTEITRRVAKTLYKNISTKRG